jgi:hypothetical protein
MTYTFSILPRIFGTRLNSFRGIRVRQPERTWGLRWRTPGLIRHLCLVALVVSACHPGDGARHGAAHSAHVLNTTCQNLFFV